MGRVAAAAGSTSVACWWAPCLAIAAARHLWIQSLPSDQVPSCGPDLGYMMGTFPLAKVLKLVFTGSGECAKVEPILGLPMPAWTLLWFVLLAVWAVLAARRRALT